MSQSESSMSAPELMSKTDMCDHEFWCRKWMVDNPPGTFDYHDKEYPIWIKCPNCQINCRLPDSKNEEPPNLNTKAVMKRYFKNFHIKSGVTSIAPSTRHFYHTIPTASHVQSEIVSLRSMPSFHMSDEFTTITKTQSVSRVRKLQLHSVYQKNLVMEPVVAGIDHQAADHLADLELGDVDLGKETVVETKHLREKIPNLEAPVSEAQNSETVVVEMEKSETMVSEAQDLELLVSVAEKSQNQRTETAVLKTQSSVTSISDSQLAIGYHHCGVM